MLDEREGERVSRHETPSQFGRFGCPAHMPAHLLHAYIGVYECQHAQFTHKFYGWYNKGCADFTALTKTNGL